MLIWSGFGFLVPLITFAFLLVTELTVDSIMRDEHFYETHGWPKLLGFLLAAIVVWVIGEILHKRKGKVVIEKETGKEIELKSNHALFFVPMRFWGPILAVLGVVFLFVKV